jgi:hypothetical protein
VARAADWERVSISTLHKLPVPHVAWFKGDEGNPDFIDDDPVGRGREHAARLPAVAFMTPAATHSACSTVRSPPEFRADGRRHATRHAGRLG